MGRKDKGIQFEDAGQVNARMRLARQQKGMTLTELALKLGYTKSHLSSVENGISRPSADLVEKYEHELGLTPGELSQADEGLEDSEDDQLEGPRRGLLVLERPADGYQVPNSVQYEVEKKEKVSLIPFVPANTSEAIPLDAPRIDLFCGRENEIADLQKWIVNDASPLVLVYGLGGIGKTTLTARLFHQHKHQFDSAGWFPLQDAPPLEDVLGRCIRSVFNDEHTRLSTDVDELMKQFVDHLRKGRYLLVFDNFESVLPEEKHEEWQMQNKNANYGKLLKKLVASDHHSCVLLTSREKPRGFGGLEARKASVHALQLQGVSLQDVREMLAEKHLQGSEADWSSLMQRYSGNPLALKLVAEPINELFTGDIAAFLREGEGISIFDDLSELLDQQFNRLSEDEKEVMYWLAIANEAIALNELQNDILSPSKRDLLTTFNMLLRRSLVQSLQGTRFELQPVIREYVTTRLIDDVYNEIFDGEVHVLSSHALMQAQAREYIRERQKKLILEPLVKRLQTKLSRQAYANKFKALLQTLRQTPQHQLTYAAGNLLNLLNELDEPISAYDFSDLFLSQAFLQGATLPDVNFSYAQFEKSIFTDTFGSILSTDLNTDGSLLAAGTMNCEVRIWQTTTGALSATCNGHTDWVRAVAFSPDKRTIASASEDTTLRLWEVETGQPLHTLVGHEKRVYALAFDKEGTLLASGGEDSNVFLWEEANDWQPRILEGHTGSVRALAISSEGLLATGSRDETIRLWSLATGECVRVLRASGNGVRALAFSPDGSLLVSGENDGAIRLWHVHTERAPELLGRHHDRVYTVAFSPDGKSIASGSEDRLVRLWRVGTLGSIQTLDGGHSDRVRSVKFTPDGKKVVSGSEDHTILFWDLSTGLCVKKLQGYSNWIHTLMFNHRGTTLAIGGEDWRIRLWRVSDGAAHEYRTLQGHNGRVRSVAFNPSDTLVASGSEDRTIRLWDAESGRWLKTLSGHGDRVWSVEFSPLGKILASGSEDHTIRLWDVRTGEVVKQWNAHSATVRSIAFHPDGTILATGSEDETIRLWDVETSQLLKTLELPATSKTIWSLAFSPDGKLLANGSEDGVIRIWNVQSGELLQEIAAHEGRIWSVAFNSSSSLVASGGEDRTVSVWKASTGEHVVRFNDHENRVRTVCFKPYMQSNTHEYIASGSHDGTARLGPLQTDAPRETLRSDRPYERMDITGVTGDINAAQRSVLFSLGAIENIQGGPLPS